MTSTLAEYKDLSPQKLQSIEKSMLPVLMCAYAKNGNSKSIKQLLEYGASPNSRYNFNLLFLKKFFTRKNQNVKLSDRFGLAPMIVNDLEAVTMSIKSPRQFLNE